MANRIYDDFDELDDDGLERVGEGRARRYRIRELPEEPSRASGGWLRILLWALGWPVLLLMRFPRSALVAAVATVAISYIASRFVGNFAYMGAPLLFYVGLIGLVLYVHAPRVMLILVAAALAAARLIGAIISEAAADLSVRALLGVVVGFGGEAQAAVIRTSELSFLLSPLTAYAFWGALLLFAASFVPALGGRRENRVIAAGVASLAGAASLLGAFWIFVIQATADLPTLNTLREYRPPVMTRVHAGDGMLIEEYARQHRVFVPIETIPARVREAFLSAEDKNFYSHDGIDYLGTLRGGLRTARNLISGSGGLESGSTITQQVAKNFLLTSEQTLVRKIREYALALRIERVLTKDQIFELYLNEIYLGRRAYGVAAAALLYFNKSLEELTIAEAAFLAALPKAPGALYRDLEEATSRRNWVIGRMLANGYITDQEAADARAEPLVYVDRLEGSAFTASEYFVEEVRRTVDTMYGEDELYYGGLSVRTTLDTEMQVMARNALREGLEEFDRRHGYRGPIDVIDHGEGWEERLAEVEIFSDIDDWSPAVVFGGDAEGVDIGLPDGTRGRILLEDLEWARRVDSEGRQGPPITDASDALRAGEVVYVDVAAPAEEETAEEGESPPNGPPRYELRQLPDANGAILAMDPHTGRVHAMVGGYSFRQSQFNRASQARRQPGSSFKPFVYAAALDTGFTPASQVLDGPYVSTSGEGQSFYRPDNYVEGRWYGLQTLRVGIEQSRNTMTVRLANEMGLDHMTEYGERFGIYDDLPPYEAMALGAGETTLSRMVAAYAMLVNGGRRIEPTILDRVQDRDGNTIYVHDDRACEGCDVEDWSAGFVEPMLPDLRPEVVEPVTAYQITSMLEGVVDRGTGRRLQSLGFPVAGKTGTTNDFRDAWFVGFTPDLVVGVYVGFDTPRPLGAGESGGRVATPVFEYFMEDAMAGRPAVPFRIPSGVRLVRIDPATGLLARPGEPGAVLEAFRPGTEPTRFATSGPGGDASEGGISIGGGDAALRGPVESEAGAAADPFDPFAPPPEGLPAEPGEEGLFPEDGVLTYLPDQEEEEAEDEELSDLY